MSLDIGDVFFKIKADLAATRDSLNDTDKQVDWYKNKWSQPVAISFTGGPGGGGGFGGGGGGSWGSSLGGGGMGPQATANKQLGISNWSTSSPNFSPQGSSNVTWTGYGVSAGGMGWTSSAGPWGKTIGMGGAFDDDVFNRGVNYYQNQSRQRSVASGIQGMEQDAFKDSFISGGLDRYRRGGVSGHIADMEASAQTQQRIEEKVTDNIQYQADRRRSIVSKSLQDMESDTSTANARLKRNGVLALGGGLTDPEDPKDEDGASGLGRIGQFIAARVAIDATAAAAQGASTIIVSNRLSRVSRASLNSSDELAQVMANRQTESSIAGSVPFGIGAMWNAGRSLRQAIDGSDPGTISTITSIGSDLEGATAGILANRRGFQQQELLLANEHNQARRTFELGKEQHRYMVEEIAKPFQERRSAIARDASLYDYDATGEMYSVGKQQMQEQNRARALYAREDTYNSQQLDIYNHGFHDNTISMGFSLDPISQGKRAMFDIQSSYDRQLNMPGGVDAADRGIVSAQGAAAIELQSRKNKQTEDMIKIDADQILRQRDVIRLQDMRLPVEAKLAELYEGEAKARQDYATETGHTVAGYAAVNAAVSARIQYEQIGGPRELREQIMPLELTGQVQGFQIQGAQAFLNRDYQGANYANKEAGYYSKFGAALIDIDKTNEPDQIAQKKSNLLQQVTMEELSLQTSISRGYAGTSKNVFQDIEMGYRNVGKEENREKEIALLDAIYKFLTKNAMGAGKGLMLPGSL